METLIKNTIQVLNLIVPVFIFLAVMVHKKHRGIGSEMQRIYNDRMFYNLRFFLIANITAIIVAFLAYTIFDMHRPLIIILGYGSDRCWMLLFSFGMYRTALHINKLSTNVHTG